MFKKEILVKNGECYVKYKIFKCDLCGTKIEEAWPKYEKDNYHLCTECAFKKGLIGKKAFLDSVGIGIDVHIGINLAGEIECWQGKSVPPWERSNEQQRGTPEYINWRKEVFKRDKYTCQECGQVGGELNAHHIKSFSKYKKLRTDLNNGITLCERCHKKLHSKRGS